MHGNKNGRNMIDVGIARVDITPETPITLAGFAARSKAETDQIIHRLFAKAIVFGNDAQGPSILIAVDLIGIQWRITREFANRLSTRTAITSDHIVICATHTHGSPEIGNLMNTLQCRGDYPAKYDFSTSLIDLNKLTHIAEYNNILNQKLEEVALAALENRKPALIDWGETQASFAINRRTPGGAVDNSLSLLRITSPDGTIRAVVINYACHGITLGPDVNAIHGDWMGEAQRTIEERHPDVTSFVTIGCAGDAHPRYQGQMQYLKLYGNEISNKIDNLLKLKLIPITSPPTAHLKWVQLPYSSLPDIEQLIELTKDTSIRGYYSRLELEQLLRGKPSQSALEYPIQVWDFGNQLTMINLGGEVVVDYSKRIKKEFKAQRLWINSYSNDVSCYIPSLRLLHEGGYEADASMYWYNKPAMFGDQIEEIIMDALHEMIPD